LLWPANYRQTLPCLYSLCFIEPERWQQLGYPYGGGFGSKIAWANWKKGDELGPFTKQVVKPPSSWLRLFSSQTLSRMDTPTVLKFSHYSPTCLWRWNRQSVSKRRHINFRRRGITQKKTYNIEQSESLKSRVLCIV